MLASSPPHVGIGRDRKCSYARRRKSSIHAGSSLIRLISSTVWRVRPAFVSSRYSTSSWKPYLYSPDTISRVVVIALLGGPSLRNGGPRRSAVQAEGDAGPPPIDEF